MKIHVASQVEVVLAERVASDVVLVDGGLVVIRSGAIAKEVADTSSKKSRVGDGNPKRLKKLLENNDGNGNKETIKMMFHLVKYSKIGHSIL